MIAFFRGMEPERLAAWQAWLTEGSIAELAEDEHVRFHDLNEDGTED